LTPPSLYATLFYTIIQTSKTTPFAPSPKAS
jgi:hypothetical protein